MVSKLKSEEQFIFSTDIGFMQVSMQTVTGYDVEDLVRDRAVSQARAVQMLNLGKSVDPAKRLGSRTVATTWLNNEEELLS